MIGVGTRQPLARGQTAINAHVVRLSYTVVEGDTNHYKVAGRDERQRYPMLRAVMFTAFGRRCTPAFAKVSGRHGVARAAPCCPGRRLRAPQIEVVWKFLQRRVVTGWLKQRQRRPQEHVDNG